jgi:hypothetical protein
MLDKTVMAEIEKVARGLGIETAALAAVAHIESGLRTHAIVNGRPEPLIRFEGHYFDRRLSGPKQQQARREGLSSPNAGAVANPAMQAARWKLLARAVAIDHKAAHESVSWGIGQVMGAHWSWLGYASVDALVREARDGVAGQMRLMARYIDKAGLADALRRRDWAAFARGYNGPGFRANDYDRKLARAYARYRLRTNGVPASRLLKLGAKGDAVRELQQALARHGHPLSQDGVFGLKTDAAVRSFQRRHGLVEDGIVGVQTQAALAEPDRSNSTLAHWLKSLFTSIFAPRRI